MTRRRRRWLVALALVLAGAAAVVAWQARRPAPALATVVEPLARDAEAVRASLASARADRARLEPQQRVDRLERESSVRPFQAIEARSACSRDVTRRTGGKG